MADTISSGNGGQRASTFMEELRSDKQEAKDALKRAEAKETLFLEELTALKRALTDITKASSGGAGAGGVDNTLIRQELREDIKAANVGLNEAQRAVTAATQRCVCHGPLTLPLFCVVVFCSTRVCVHVCVRVCV
jgi:hypothetical protein